MRPDICPNCGAEVPENARACPGCGSDEQTGWSEKASVDALDLPDEEFDYEDFAAREFGAKKSVRPRGLNRFWWVIAVLVLIAIVMLWLKLT
jgi:uncharacterized membrane protein YvbJ